MKPFLFSAIALLTLCAPHALRGQIMSDNVKKTSAKTTTRSATDRLYSLNGAKLLWLCDDCSSKRGALLYTISHAFAYGLDAPSGLAHVIELLAAGPASTVSLRDKRISEAAIQFCRRLYEGDDIRGSISYDGVAASLKDQHTDFLLQGLAAAKDSNELIQFFQRLEPQSPEYLALKRALDSAKHNDVRQRQLKSALNYYRWFSHFHLDSFIVINIPSATLRYYKHDTLALEMKTVVGTPAHRTPRFSAYIREVTLYPYWNMPRSILMKEWISSFRKNPGLIDFLSMEIIDGKGRKVAASAVRWRSVKRTGFPYRIREKPGCFNPMGVVKFSLTSPYDVYLHDTNFKEAFLAKNRFYSHGCIRLEQPIALADAVLVQPVNEDFLKACFKDQQPQSIALDHPVPLFVTYMCAERDSTGAVRYYNDVYGLLKQKRNP